MIANTDWGISNRHNLEMVLMPGYKRLIAVPYDFDYAGMVGTTYAVPHASFPIKYVKDRWFRGQKVTKEEALAIRQFFLDKREAILDRCRSAEFLGERSKKEAYRFIEEFFEELENEKRVVRTFCHR